MGIVHVTLTNHFAYLTDYSNSDFEKLKDWWSYFYEKARWVPAYKSFLQEQGRAARERREPDPRIGWDGRIRLLKAGKLPAGLFRATRWDAAEETGVQFKVTRDLPTKPAIIGSPRKETEAKYSYQTECVDAMLKAVRRGGGIVLAATAAGKTKIAADFFSRLDCNCLFIVDQRNLLYQSQEALAKWSGEAVGVVGDSNYTVERITVATVQTLDYHLLDGKFSKWYKSVKVVVVDELHDQMARRNFDVLGKIKPVARFGLTATLEMGQEAVRMKAWAFAGPVIYEFSYAEGRKRGVLADGKFVQVLFPEEGEGIQREYQEEVDEEILKNEVKYDACIKIVEWLLEQGRYVLVLADRQAHIERLHARFAHIPHGLAYGPVRIEDRTAAIKKFEVGKLRLIIASRVLKKGADIKRMDAIVDVAEMPNKNDAKQKFGRGVRIHKDKGILWYVDFSTATGRFGRAGKRRAKALAQNGVEVVKFKVRSAARALRVVVRCLLGSSNVS